MCSLCSFTVRYKHVAFNGIYFIFMPLPTYWLEALCIGALRESAHLCICPCTPNVVNTMSWKVVDIFSQDFQHRCILGHGWTFQILVSRAKFKVTVGPACCKVHFLALLNVNAISGKLQDWISPNFLHWCIFRTRMNTSVFEVEGQSHSVTKSPADGGIQHLTLCIEL